MARGGGSPAGSIRALEVTEREKTSRVFARADVAKTVLPFAFAAAGLYGVASEIAGETTQVNVALGISFVITVPAALIKVLWDRSQKRKLRARNAELEEENRTLIGEKGELNGQIAELRRQLNPGQRSQGPP